MPRTNIVTRPRHRAVAVTGADGIVGRILVGVLEEDPTVSRIVALDLKSPHTAGPKTRFYKIDLTQPHVDARIAEILEAERIDALAHLAFFSSPSHAHAYAHELESVGTMQLLDAVRQRPIEKLVVLSQTLLYGPRADNPNFLTESHELRGLPDSPYLRDKIAAEREVARFVAERSNVCVTILRLAPLLGPTVQSWVTRWLSRRLVPTAMGFDPLVQFVHELDAVAAFIRAIALDAPGTFNIVGEGVLPVSTVVKLAGRASLPVPYFLAQRGASVLWAARLAEAPPELVAFLRYLCVASGEHAREGLGFRPAFTSREAVLDFGGTLRLRDARMLVEAR